MNILRSYLSFAKRVCCARRKDYHFWSIRYLKQPISLVPAAATLSPAMGAKTTWRALTIHLTTRVDYLPGTNPDRHKTLHDHIPIRYGNGQRRLQRRGDTCVPRRASRIPRETSPNAPRCSRPQEPKHFTSDQCCAVIPSTWSLYRASAADTQI